MQKVDICFCLSLILVGLLGLSLMTDMPVPTENADAMATAFMLC